MGDSGRSVTGDVKGLPESVRPYRIPPQNDLCVLKHTDVQERMKVKTELKKCGQRMLSALFCAPV